MDRLAEGKDGAPNHVCDLLRVPTPDRLADGKTQRVVEAADLVRHQAERPRLPVGINEV